MILIVAAVLAVFIAGCTGLGLWAQRWTGRQDGQTDPTPAPLLGCAFVIWASALLNAAGVFHLGVLIALVVLGCAQLASRLRAARCDLGAATAQMLPGVVVIGMVLLMIFIPPEFNLNDDGPGYLLFSRKLAALGSTGVEPFSERRLYSLGGQFGLVAAVQSLFGTRWLSLYEPGLGLALIAATVWLRARAEPLKAALQLAIVLGLAVISLTVGSRPIANLAPAMLYCAILTGCVLVWLTLAARERDDDGGQSDLIQLALFSATALSLRPTALPFIALLAISAAGFVLVRRRWLDLAIAAAVAAVVMAPSLTASFKASETLLYPFLGHGVHNPGAYLPSAPMEVIRMAASELPGAALLGLFLVVAVIAGRCNPRWGPALLLATITLAAYVCVTWAIGGEQLSRYSFPFVFAAFTALVMQARPPHSWGLDRPVPGPLGVMAGVAVAALLVAFALPLTEQLAMTKAPAVLAARWAQPAFTPTPERVWVKAQLSVPEGATILSVGGRYTALMNVRRNRVLAADQPATAGPGGGWPTHPGSPKAYLSAQGVDYVLVDTSFIASRPAADTAWRRRLAAATSLAQAQFSSATTGVRPAYADADLLIYRVTDLNR